MVNSRFLRFLSALSVGVVLLAAAGWVRSQFVVDDLQASWARMDMSVCTWPDRLMVFYVAPTGTLSSDLVVTHESDRLLPGPAPDSLGGRVAYGYYCDRTTGNGLFPAKTAHTLVVPFWLLVAVPAIIPLLRFVWCRRSRQRRAAAFPVTPTPPEK